MRCSYRCNMWCKCKKPVHHDIHVTWIWASSSSEVTIDEHTSTVVTFTYSPNNASTPWSDIVLWVTWEAVEASFVGFENWTARIGISAMNPGSATVWYQIWDDTSTRQNITATVPSWQQFSPTNNIIVDVNPVWEVTTRKTKKTKARWAWDSYVAKVFAANELSQDYVRLEWIQEWTPNVQFVWWANNEYCTAMFTEQVNNSLAREIETVYDSWWLTDNSAKFVDSAWEEIETYFAEPLTQESIEEIHEEIIENEVIRPAIIDYNNTTTTASVWDRRALYLDNGLTPSDATINVETPWIVQLTGVWPNSFEFTCIWAWTTVVYASYNWQTDSIELTVAAAPIVHVESISAAADTVNVEPWAPSVRVLFSYMPANANDIANDISITYGWTLITGASIAWYFDWSLTLSLTLSWAEGDDSVTCTVVGSWVSSSTAIHVAQPAQTWTVDFDVNDANMGSVDVAQLTDIPDWTQYTYDNNTVTVNWTTVTATANTWYHFLNWWDNFDNNTITHDGTISAYFEADPVPPTPTGLSNIWVVDLWEEQWMPNPEDPEDPTEYRAAQFGARLFEDWDNYLEISWQYDENPSSPQDIMTYTFYGHDDPTFIAGLESLWWNWEDWFNLLISSDPTYILQDWTIKQEVMDVANALYEDPTWDFSELDMVINDNAPILEYPAEPSIEMENSFGVLEWRTYSAWLKIAPADETFTVSVDDPSIATYDWYTYDWYIWDVWQYTLTFSWVSEWTTTATVTCDNTWLTASCTITVSPVIHIQSISAPSVNSLNLIMWQVSPQVTFTYTPTNANVPSEDVMFWFSVEWVASLWWTQFYEWTWVGNFNILGVWDTTLVYQLVWDPTQYSIAIHVDAAVNISSISNLSQWVTLAVWETQTVGVFDYLPTNANVDSVYFQASSLIDYNWNLPVSQTLDNWTYKIEITWTNVWTWTIDFEFDNQNYQIPLTVVWVPVASIWAPSENSVSLSTWESANVTFSYLPTNASDFGSVTISSDDDNVASVYISDFSSWTATLSITWNSDWVAQITLTDWSNTYTIDVDVTAPVEPYTLSSEWELSFFNPWSDWSLRLFFDPTTPEWDSYIDFNWTTDPDLWEMVWEPCTFAWVFENSTFATNIDNAIQGGIVAPFEFDAACMNIENDAQGNYPWWFTITQEFMDMAQFAWDSEDPADVENMLMNIWLIYQNPSSIVWDYIDSQVEWNQFTATLTINPDDTFTVSDSLWILTVDDITWQDWYYTVTFTSTWAGTTTITATADNDPTMTWEVNVTIVQAVHIDFIQNMWPTSATWTLPWWDFWGFILWCRPIDFNVPLQDLTFTIADTNVVQMWDIWTDGDAYHTDCKFNVSPVWLWATTLTVTLTSDPTYTVQYNIAVIPLEATEMHNAQDMNIWQWLSIYNAVDIYPNQAVAFTNLSVSSSDTNIATVTFDTASKQFLVTWVSQWTATITYWITGQTPETFNVVVWPSLCTRDALYDQGGIAQIYYSDNATVLVNEWSSQVWVYWWLANSTFSESIATLISSLTEEERITLFFWISGDLLIKTTSYQYFEDFYDNPEINGQAYNSLLTHLQWLAASQDSVFVLAPAITTVTLDSSSDVDVASFDHSKTFTYSPTDWGIHSITTQTSSSDWWAIFVEPHKTSDWVWYFEITGSSRWTVSVEVYANGVLQDSFNVHVYDEIWSLTMDNTPIVADTSSPTVTRSFTYSPSDGLFSNLNVKTTWLTQTVPVLRKVSDGNWELSITFLEQADASGTVQVKNDYVQAPEISYTFTYNTSQA